MGCELPTLRPAMSVDGLAGMVNKSLRRGDRRGWTAGDWLVRGRWHVVAPQEANARYDLGYVGEICSVEPRWLDRFGVKRNPVLSSWRSVRMANTQRQR